MNIPKPKSKVLSIRNKKGLKIIQSQFTGKHFSRAEIERICLEYGKQLKNKMNGTMHVSLPFPRGWRSGGWTPLGEPVKLWSDKDYNIADPNHFDTFIVYIQKSATPAGGNNDTNSCFFDCLKKLIPENVLPWKTDEAFKQSIKVPVNAMVPISKMHLIQKQLPKYQIFITGDHVYTSPNNTPHHLKIQLVDGHYSIVKLPKFVYGISYTEKKPLIYEPCDGFYECFAENKRFQLDKKTFKMYWDNVYLSPYLLIKYDDYKYTSKPSHLKAFMLKADKYKKATNGLINFYKSKSDVNTSLDLFYHFNKNIDVDIIEQDEAYWISETMIGGLIYAEPYQGEGWDYDIISRYPSIQKDPHMLFPIKRGEFFLITTDEFINKTFYQYGIYRVVIEFDAAKKKAFRWNNNNLYTHIDLTLAKKIGLKYHIIDDGKVNALIYSRDKLVTGSQLFGQFVDLVYPLKEKGLPDAKTLLNCLWGKLCEKDKKVHLLKPETEFELYDNREIVKIVPKSLQNTDDLVVKYADTTKMYKFPYARIGPFLTAKARLTLGTLINEHYDHIVRIHTDGFISTAKLNVKLGDILGDLSYKGYCENIEVINANSITGKFEKI